MKQDRVIALGFFDGVHIGHAALLNRAKAVAEQLDCESAALTFDNHPDELVFGRPTPLINTLPDRRRIMARTFRLDQILSIPFDRALMQTPWEVFVDELLVRRLRAVHVVCGHDFTFGFRGEGNPRRLQEKCAELGIGCDVIPPVMHEGVVVSSTRIRQLLQEGKVEEANTLLGHRHFIVGEVIYGKQMGRRMGTPTANLQLPEGILRPALGVYATEVVLEDGSRHPAVTNVGTCPTVEMETGVTVESWLLDFRGDLYHQHIRVEFCKFLRPEQKFDTVEELKAAILQNAEQTRAFFHLS